MCSVTLSHFIHALKTAIILYQKYFMSTNTHHYFSLRLKVPFGRETEQSLAEIFISKQRTYTKINGSTVVMQKDNYTLISLSNEELSCNYDSQELITSNTRVVSES